MPDYSGYLSSYSEEGGSGKVCGLGPAVIGGIIIAAVILIGGGVGVAVVVSGGSDDDGGARVDNTRGNQVTSPATVPTCPEIDNAVYNLTMDELVPGVEIFVECEDGFASRAENMSTVECTSYGEWSENVECEIVCGDPPKINNGKIVNETENVFVGDVVEYRCDDGHFAHGNNSEELATECGVDGNYTLETNDLAVCAVISCRRPAGITGANYSEQLRDEYIEGHTIGFSCTEGFIPAPPSGQIECGKNGWMWEGVCNRFCEIPTVADATSTVNSIMLPPIHGTRVDYQCNSGYLPDTIQSAVCGELRDGQIDVSSIECHKDQYTFKITSKKGNFDQARKECIQMGGDLITTNMKPQGQKYNTKIRSLVRSHGYTLWVGITDRDEEEKWKFVTDNSDFEPNGGNTLFRWDDGEPNNHDNSQDCGCISFGSMTVTDFTLDDKNCEFSFSGLCELKNF